MFSGAASRKVAVKELRRRKSRDLRPLRTGKLLVSLRLRLLPFANCTSEEFQQQYFSIVRITRINCSLRRDEKELNSFRFGLSYRGNKISTFLTIIST